MSRISDQFLQTVRFLRAFILLFLIGCDSSELDAEMQKWVGHSKTELIQAWGSPSSVKTEPDSTEVFSYARRYLRYDYTFHPWTGSYVTTREFTVDRNGIITGWRLLGK